VIESKWAAIANARVMNKQKKTAKYKQNEQNSPVRFANPRKRPRFQKTTKKHLPHRPIAWVDQSRDKDEGGRTNKAPIMAAPK